MAQRVKMSKTLVAGIALVCTLLFCVPAQAATLVVNGDGADNQVAHDGTLQFVGFTGEHRVGADGRGQNMVYVFALPALPAGETVASADLQFTLSNVYTFGDPVNADLYGVRSSASSLVGAADFYWGPLDGSAALIQDNILVNGMATGVINTDAAGDTALGAWLQSEYDGGAVAGEFVFIRLSGDIANSTANRNYRVLSANDANPANRPVLTIETAGAAPGTIGKAAPRHVFRVMAVALP